MTTNLPLVLYRATVLTREDASQASPLPEHHVFYEAQRPRSAQVLDTLLHFAWAVDVSTLLITTSSERELIEDFALGPASDGDVRLFEDGHDTEHIFYCDPALTQFFVRPDTQVRLQAAQAIAIQRRMELRARRPFDVARRTSYLQWIERHATRGEA